MLWFCQCRAKDKFGTLVFRSRLPAGFWKSVQPAADSSLCARSVERSAPLLSRSFASISQHKSWSIVHSSAFAEQKRPRPASIRKHTSLDKPRFGLHRLQDGQPLRSARACAGNTPALGSTMSENLSLQTGFRSCTLLPAHTKQPKQPLFGLVSNSGRTTFFCTREYQICHSYTSGARCEPRVESNMS